VTKAHFIRPMLLRPADRLAEGPEWQYEIKLDGYRAIAYKSDHQVRLRSRTNREFGSRYAAVVAALGMLPDETVVDGELAALDESGQPSFKALEYQSRPATLCYYVFDVMILGGRDVMAEPLAERRERLADQVLAKLGDSIREPSPLGGRLDDLILAVKTQGLGGLVAKRLNSGYEPGLCSGAWQKMSVNLAQDFVIGGYTLDSQTQGAVLLGHYAGNQLMYVAQTSRGITPEVRDQLFRLLRQLQTSRCPFENLPESTSGRWSDRLTAKAMRPCRWVEPVLVAEVEFLEWTHDGHLRQARFLRLRNETNGTR